MTKKTSLKYRMYIYKCLRKKFVSFINIGWRTTSKYKNMSVIKCILI